MFKPTDDHLIDKQAIDEKTIIAERNISYIRAAVIAVNTLTYLFMSKAGTIPWLAYTIICSSSLYGYYVIYYKPYIRFPIFFASYFTYFFDVLFISVWIFATGGFESPYYVLFYPSIIAVAFRFSLKNALLSSIFYSICYFIALFLVDEVAGNELLIFLRTAYIFLTAGLASLITRETALQVNQRMMMEKLAGEAKKSEEALRKSETILSEKNQQLFGALHELNQVRENLESLNMELEVRVWKRTQQLKESEEYFRFVAESIPQLVWTTDPAGNADYFNSKWSEYTGQTTSDQEGLGWQNAIHPDDRNKTACIWSDSVERKKIYTVEYRLKSKESTYRWFLARGAPMVNNNNEVTKWFGTCTDIHDTKIAFEKLAQTKDELSLKNQQLVNINNELDNFIYTASHDLKAPITNIEGLLNMLKIQTVPENSGQEKIIDLMSKSTERFKKTLFDLTEVSKAQKNIEENRLEDVCLLEVIEDIKETISELIRANDASITVDLNNIPKIRFSTKNLRSILYNLISNGVKYRSPERAPQIHIHCEKTNGFIKISVSDNGLGIKEGNIEKLFILFKRLHDHIEGTGVGLYIVKRIVENAGGKIEVESEQNIGTEFHVYLPC